VTNEVTLGEARATADDLHGALPVAAELVGEARSRVTITCDGEPDEGATELPREGPRPVQLGHASKSHLGEATQES
jgi:hypothetical protein